jgi:UPF0755 protein
MFAIVGLLLLAGLVLGSAGYWWLSQENLNQTSVVVVIEKGQTLNHMAQQWEDEGWLRSALRLKVAARLTGGARDIRAGEFIIPPRLNSLTILPYLAEAQTRTYRVSLIEGRRLSAALESLGQAEHLQQDLGPLTRERVSDYLDLSVDVEAQLYPDTYVYHRNQPVSEIITQAHDRLNQVLKEEWDARSENLPYSEPYEALVMASIIEKETGVASERPVIAGVFVRRLQKNMRLETDPTVIYGLGESFDGNLTRAHLRDRSNPYNTYRNKGLPPGPIALAGREAIRAALNPADGTELFFVARGDGSHYFSSTLEEHNKAVRRYQLSRRSDYRSAPNAQQGDGEEN